MCFKDLKVIAQVKFGSQQASDQATFLCSVCRSYGLTRTFDKDDMNELAKVAEFINADGSSRSSVLSEIEWTKFGDWFMR